MYNGHPPPNYPSGYGYPPQEQYPPPPPPTWAPAPAYLPDQTAQAYPPPPPPEWYNQPPAGPSSQPYPIPASYPPPPPDVYPPQAPPLAAAFRNSLPSSQADSSATPEVVHEIKSEAKGEHVKEKPGKKKRKKGEETTTSPADGGGDKADGKRTKTGRACDACRTKKIRCDILSPIELPNGEMQPICAHCKQYGLECTFYMPITETRFKKKKQASTTDDPGDSTVISNPLVMEGTTSPHDDRRPREVPVRMEGPTSLSFLLQTALPAGASEAYDLRSHNKWEISEDGTGMIRVSAPPSDANMGDHDDKSRSRSSKPVLSAQTMSELVNAYFEHIAPLFPVLSKAEFIAKSNVSPLLLYAICGLGATRRQFPREVFAGVRGVINGLLRSNDILSDARFEHVQALLLLAQVGDLHAQPTAATASASLMRMGIAIRMAQDLGLHRESTIRAQTAEDLAFVELRRRVWATCVIMDRWYGAALGVPLLVDLLDCDVLLPAPYDIRPDTEPSSWPIEPTFLALAEHLKLSILIGRVLKTIYSPTGLKNATDEQLNSLLADMTSWKDNMPEELLFKGPQSSHASGLLHMAYAALQFLFWRVFMRIQYHCPPHLTFRLKVEHWSGMVQLSADSITWLSQNDNALDTVFIYPYTATSSALIQYHTWARRRSPEALEMLKLIKETATRWADAVQPDQMSIRRKTCETMTLLYEAALKTNPEVEEPKDRPLPLNPTAGVSMRSDVGRIVWIRDDNLPNGGIWVAATDQDRQEGGVEPSECILEADLEPGSEVARQWNIAKQQGIGKANNPSSSDTVEMEHSNGHAYMDSEAVQQHQQHQTMSQIAQPGGMGSMNMQSQSIPELGAFSDLQSGPNVNPQMNFEGFFPPAMTVTAAGSEVVSNSVPQADGSFIDMSLLDGLPTSNFDFPSWEQYFQQINGGIVSDNFGGIQQHQ